MNFMYEKADAPAGGLRLHLNENTGGCSPAVRRALQELTTTDAAFYPDYSPAVAAACGYLDVSSDELLLTNGLDEGILAACIVALRGFAASDPGEALIVVPAFDMFAASADALGGRVTAIGLAADFSFPTDAVLGAVSSRTRIIFITDPNNPTGTSVPIGAITRVAAAAPQALVFVDQAYAEFRGEKRIDRALLALPNVVVGRTFAKAHGLAALRIGALVSRPGTIETLRRVVPPYSINVAAAVALPAALADGPFIDRYLGDVRASRELLYAALQRLDVPFWRSDANFVLARFGERTADLVSALRARGIHVRDRSKAPLCEGCVRITSGVLEHTQQAVSAIEEVLCAAR